MLFRFAVADNDNDVARELYQTAVQRLVARGHTQVLIYTPANGAVLQERYEALGMRKGSNYTCYWQDI
jgi:hypothetical protein